MKRQRYESFKILKKKKKNQLSLSTTKLSQLVLKALLLFFPPKKIKNEIEGRRQEACEE